MTVSELEQAMRNLVSSQPMITVGPNGEVVSSLLAIIDAYKNFSFKVQTYQSQDTFKFGMMAEIQKLEETMSNYICQTMASRGINIMLYSPQAQFGGTMGGFGGVQPMNPMAQMGQMMYPQQTGFAQPQPQPQVVQPNQFSGIPSMMTPINQPPMTQPYAKPQVSQPSPRPQAPKPVVQPTPAPAPSKPSSSEDEIPGSAKIEVAKPSPAEALMGEASDTPAGKAPGRDYLLELLKKK